MTPLLVFVPALALYAGLLYGCYWIWDEADAPVIAIVTALIIGPLGVVLLVGLHDELWTEHPMFVLDQREWECSASHREPVTTYIKSGNAMLPLTSYRKVCDLYGRKP